MAIREGLVTSNKEKRIECYKGGKWYRKDLTVWEWEGTIEENILEKITSVKDLKKSIWKPTTVEFQQ